MTGIVTVYATFADAEEANRIALQLVEERLAACANILGPARAVYRWQGKVEQADEVAALFKTTSGQATQLIRRLAELHSYDTPACTVWPIAEAPESFRKWVVDNSG
jgi:periplasmic divalent cation tolerance protein